MKKILLATTLLLATGIVSAQEWKFYGSARVGAFGKLAQDSNKTFIDSLKGTNYYLQGNSRFGAEVKYEDRSGLVEVGNNGSQITLRRLFGTWKATEQITVLVGQEWSIINHISANQAWGPNGDNLLYNQGAITTGRNPQIRVSHSSGVSIALYPGKQNSAPLSNADSLIYKTDSTFLPKLEIGFEKKVDKITANFGIGVNSYTYTTDSTITGYDEEYTIKSLLVAGGVKAEIAKANIRAYGAYALNGKDYGLSITLPKKKFGTSVDSTGELHNVSTVLSYLAASYEVTKMIVPEFGAGLEMHMKDDAVNTRTTFYGQVAINPIKGVTFVPEFGAILEQVSDLDKDTKKTETIKSPDILYWGAKAQISF